MGKLNPTSLNTLMIILHVRWICWLFELRRISKQSSVSDRF